WKVPYAAFVRLAMIRIIFRRLAHDHESTRMAPQMIKFTSHHALKFAQSSLAKMGFGVMRNEPLTKLKEDYRKLKEAAINESNAYRDLQFLLALPNHQGSLLLKYLPKSKAEFRQDLFVLSELNFKHEGYFVEFGAANGYAGSNTYLLEKELS